MSTTAYLKPFVLIPIALLTMLSLSVFGQDKLLLQNGIELDCKIEQMDDSLITITQVNKKGQPETDFVDSFRAFSVMRNGQETVIYQQDTTIGNYFTVDEMRTFISGEQYGINNYNRWPAFAVGVIVGGIGGYAVADSPLLVVTTPVAITVGSTFFGSRVPRKAKSTVPGFKDEVFTMGYKRVAKSKKLVSVLTGSAVGTALGFAARFLAPAN